MAEEASNLVQRMHEQEINRIREEAALPRTEATTYSPIDLPEAAAGNPVAEEWNLFRREVSRLIAEGARGRIALVKVGQPITLWDTTRDAVQAGRLLFGQELCLVQEIQPVLRPLHHGCNERCRD
jgi:hypothetical protein